MGFFRQDFRMDRIFDNLFIKTKNPVNPEILSKNPPILGFTPRRYGATQILFVAS